MRNAARTMTRLNIPAFAAACLAPLLCNSPAVAEKIENQIAVFSGLDKITAVITTFEIPLDQKKIFGVLEVTPRVCYSRPPTEPPKTTAFVEVNELRTDAAPRKIFTGWMFADSPGLNAVEHPVYDIWLTSCKTSSGSPSPSNE